MHAKLALSLALAALILAAGGLLIVVDRLDRLEARPGAATAAAPAPRATPKASPHEGAGGRASDGEAKEDPLASKDPLVKLDWVIQKLDEMASDNYDSYSDMMSDLYSLKRQVGQLKAMFKLVIQGLRSPGHAVDIGWGLLPKGVTPDEKALAAYRKAAKEFGIQVEDGRVTVRGFLNMSPNTRMPIEYFITRYPESGYETLIHLVGNKDLATLDQPPYDKLRGLATALYKALLAAGFHEGEPTHPAPGSTREHPEWVLASGDTVYIGVRYTMNGKTSVARATDWVVDPAANAVLPPDCMRFTGGVRSEDPDTGEPILAAEQMGLLVSVWPAASSLVEVALRSSWRDDYGYNFSRIPQPKGPEPLYLDIIFSKTPIEPEGEGARPLERPPAGDTGAKAPHVQPANAGSGGPR